MQNINVMLYEERRQVAAVDEPFRLVTPQEADAADVIQLPWGGDAYQSHVRPGEGFDLRQRADALVDV